MKNVMFQIKYDFINGIVHQWKKFLLIAVVYAVLITDFLVRCKTKHFMGQYTSSDIILYIFRGMRWIVDVQTDINIPTAYILPNILIGFAIGNYPFKDINGYGGMVLMRAGKKLVWWISKCIWAVLTACICYGILILEIAGVSLAGGRLSLQVNRQVCISIDGYDKTLIKNNPNLTRLAVYMIIVGLLTTIAICLVQICVSQIMGPIIGYIAVVVILIMGVFFRSFLFIGNGFMALRNIMYTPEGGSLTLTVIADIVLIVVSVIAGYASFRRMDILKKSDWMVIKLTNVSKVIKKAKVLDNVNLELTSGKVYGLKGKNGSGKTMLMRVICGLISATEGTVEIDGKILGKDMTFPDSVGVLIENPAFIGNYTGFKNLKVLASIQNRVDDEHIREVIHQVGLDPDDKRTYRKYSLGMKQKLGIAAAYMENPDLIILDEPINALDEAGAKQVHEILEEQKKRGALIIIACHDKEELEMLSDEIIEISEGRIIEK